MAEREGREEGAGINREARDDGSRRRALHLSFLIRRRQVWLPTLWGWLVLCLLGALTAVALALGANDFLAPNEPARGRDGSGARTLVVEGWLDAPEIAQAVAAFRRGRYARVLTTGGPIEPWSDIGGWQNYAVRGAAYLRRHGLTEVPIIAVPAPETQQDRSYLSALMVREWAEQSGTKLEAIDLFSAGVHARRSRWVYRMALGGDVEVGVFAAVPKEFDAEHWWRTSSGTKTTLGEAISLLWTGCCFWPPAPQ